ncbi:P-loop containing nucleoside triphosphate hydrolase protein [Emericellopsis atlantica]|uniref:ATP-dependent RNA helicase n=1 Tax=Emericellopsis atlantica TaxID=2614577 RepID=A0A9P7ZWA1_9HYPO|nr:P-loop containing nucleoside triphosphate hydrolase protein [Emericellopsis atlantica]KAG9258906.1 P-loop containing nucleoside triphosphate hydrolase protein [Emericellopsis atlantica]
MDDTKRPGPYRRPGKGGRGGRGGRGGGGRGRGSRSNGQGQDRHAPSHDDHQDEHNHEQLAPVKKETSAPQATGAPTTSDRRFADLQGVHPLIVKAITEDLKFENMTPVQAATVDELLPPNRHDCLVQAKTGTGKTLAFLIPALQTMITQKRPADAGISLLVISPTRELSMQIATEATNLLQRLPQYRVRVVMGGTNKNAEERQILGGCEILIATPGRLLDHLSNPDIVWAVRNVDTLVLDEADRLLDMGFKRDLQEIVRHLPDKKKTNRQGMLFSATIAPHVQQVASLVLDQGYEFISTIPAGDVNTHQRVPQYLIEVPDFGSVAPAMVGCIQEEAARTDLGGPFKAILFAPTAALADFYGNILSSLPGVPPIHILHSRISQNRRTKTTDLYRASPSAILVATDVVARGMDFPGVTTVLQVGIPSDKQSYIHRLGRTARAEADGHGVFIVAAAEAWFPKYTLKEIEFKPRQANMSSAESVMAIATRMQDQEKGKIYQAWLGYYNNHMKFLKWDKEELVRQGNVYARNGLGAPEVPAMAKSTVGKMGLKGVKGLRVVPDPPRQSRNGGRGGRGGRQ